jgi:hypothetical protein
MNPNEAPFVIAAVGLFQGMFGLTIYRVIYERVKKSAPRLRGHFGKTSLALGIAFYLLLPGVGLIYAIHTFSSAPWLPLAKTWNGALGAGLIAGLVWHAKIATSEQKGKGK